MDTGSYFSGLDDVNLLVYFFLLPGFCTGFAIFLERRFSAEDVQKEARVLDYNLIFFNRV